MGLVPLLKTPESSLTLFPPCEDTEEDCHLQSRKWTLIRHPTGQHLDLRHPNSRTVKEKYLLFKLSGLWCFYGSNTTD